MYIDFFFNDTATTEIYTLSLHDALPIYVDLVASDFDLGGEGGLRQVGQGRQHLAGLVGVVNVDRKSTRLNSSHSQISYAVFCLKKKKNFSNTIFDLAIHIHHMTLILPRV